MRFPQKIQSSPIRKGEDEYKVNILGRMSKFWFRAANIYRSYKIHQLKIATVLKNLTNEDKYASWSTVHELNSDRMLALCLDLRGFYLKVGQVMGTRADFMPPPYIKKLSQLHDRVPKISATHARQVVESELRKHNNLDRNRTKLLGVEDYFEALDFHNPIGCASICQVHKAIWKPTNSPCAVKIQYPGKKPYLTREQYPLPR